LEALAGQTTLTIVNKSTFASLPVLLPPLDEQRRIAARLSEQMAMVYKARQAAETELEAAKALPAALLRHVFESDEARGWPSRKLGDVCTVVSGGTPSKAEPRYWEGDVPWVSPKDMKVFDLVDAQDHLTEAGASACSSGVLSPGAVLVVVRGMILARDVPVSVSRVPLAINQDMKALIPLPRMSYPDYLAYALVAHKARLLELVTPSAHATLKLDTGLLRDLTIQCPASLEVQARVAAEIASNLGGSERTQKAVEGHVEAVNTLPGALLEEVFGGFEPPT
jgi:type I restriction enzyme S subunit